jgi:hypothetical protein
MSHLWWINHFGDFEIYDHQTKITILNHHFGDGFSHFAYHKKVLKAHSICWSTIRAYACI